MNARILLRLGLALALSLAVARAADPAPTGGPRVGVYDSRIVAFAHFWSELARQERDALIAAAKAAKESDAARFKELTAQIVAGQKRSHLQVFSTAPAEEAMAALKDRLPAIQRELGVTRLVSKWDEAAVKDVGEANWVDATDRVVREFLPRPTERQQKTMAEMKKATPLPLAHATKLAEAGKL